MTDADGASGMAARLGIVLYWIGSICALLLFSVAAVVTFNILSGRIEPGDSPGWILPIAAAIAALIAYGVGRAFRYVLAGR